MGNGNKRLLRELGSGLRLTTVYGEKIRIRSKPIGTGKCLKKAKTLATTSLTPGQYPDNYISDLTQLRNLLTEIGERIKNRLFTEKKLQGLTRTSGTAN